MEITSPSCAFLSDDIAVHETSKRLPLPSPYAKKEAVMKVGVKDCFADHTKQRHLE